MAPLTLTQAAEQQALSEGYQSGPVPTLNPANVFTQTVELNNPLTPIAEPVPYYPPATKVTPNLGLSLQGMDAVLAEDLVLLDTAFGTVPNVLPQGRLQAVNINTPQSVSFTAATTTLYTVSIYVASYGTGAGGANLVTTLTWTDPSGTTHVITLSLAGNVVGVQMEQYPIFVGAGQTVTVAETFNTTPFNYDASIRIVQMP